MIEVSNLNNSSKKDLNKSIAIGVLNDNQYWSSYDDYSFPGDIEKRLMENLSVSTPLFRLVRSIGGMDLTIEKSKVDITEEDLEEVRRKHEHIENFRDFIEVLSMTPYFQHSCHEKIYSLDGNGNFYLKELKLIPNHYLDYDTKKFKNGWYIKSDLTGTDIEITENKFILSIYQPDVDNPKGKSLFNYGIKKAFMNLESVEANIDKLQKKYGDVITIHGFDSRDAELPGHEDRIRERNKSFQNLSGGDSVAFPKGSYDKGKLSDSIHFITLADLKIEIHDILLKRFESQIELFIMGSHFSTGAGGSFARDQVQESEKEKVTKHLTEFVEDELNKILQFDSWMASRDIKDFYYKFRTERTDKEKAELRKTEAEAEEAEGDAIKSKAEGYDALVTSIANMKALKMPDDFIAATFNVDIELVKNIEAAKKQAPLQFEMGEAKSGRGGATGEKGRRRPFILNR